MNIPRYLQLEPRQIAKLEQWEARQKLPSIEEHDEMYGGCCMTSCYVFTVRNSSICTEISCTNEFTKQKCDLTIDDDNELSPLT